MRIVIETNAQDAVVAGASGPSAELSSPLGATSSAAAGNLDGGSGPSSPHGPSSRPAAPHGTAPGVLTIDAGTPSTQLLLAVAAASRPGSGLASPQAIDAGRAPEL